MYLFWSGDFAASVVFATFYGFIKTGFNVIAGDAKIVEGSKSSNCQPGSHTGYTNMYFRRSIAELLRCTFPCDRSIAFYFL